MSIYLGLTPDALITHEKIVNLFFSLLVNENCRELPEHNPDLKYQCLILLDEFTSMGKSEVIERAVGFTAGYNLRFMFILQNEGQGQKAICTVRKDGTHSLKTVLLCFTIRRNQKCSG